MKKTSQKIHVTVPLSCSSGEKIVERFHKKGKRQIFSNMNNMTKLDISMYVNLVFVKNPFTNNYCIILLTDPSVPLSPERKKIHVKRLRDF